MTSQELKRPNQPASQDRGHTQTPTSEQKALAISTSVAHGIRTALNGQVDHIAGLQQAYSEALEPIADEASDLFAGAISGELLWQEIAARTQEKLDALPKPQRIDLSPKALKPFCINRSAGAKNRFLSSSPAGFLEGN